MNVDYESEVDDDMLSIFRKGEVGTNLHFLYMYLWPVDSTFITNCE
jgi:hypothetical protein